MVPFIKIKYQSCVQQDATVNDQKSQCPYKKINITRHYLM